MVLANLGYALIAMHTAAALFHHYVIRDNALLLMMPQKKRADPSQAPMPAPEISRPPPANPERI